MFVARTVRVTVKKYAKVLKTVHCEPNFLILGCKNSKFPRNAIGANWCKLRRNHIFA